MYEAVRRSAKPRREWQIPLLVTVVLLISAVILTPIIYSLHQARLYKSFVNDFTDSIIYGEENGCITCTYNGEVFSVSEENAGNLYYFILYYGSGKPQRELPDADFCVVDFGDGSNLAFASVYIPEKNAERKYGAFISYTGKDGKVYSFDTDRYGFDLLFSAISQ